MITKTFVKLTAEFLTPETSGIIDNQAASNPDANDDENDNIRECQIEITKPTEIKKYEGFFENNHTANFVAVATAICGCSKTPTITTSADNIGGGPSHYSGSTDITWTANCPGGGTATETGTAEYDFWVYQVEKFKLKPGKILKNGDSVSDADFEVKILPADLGVMIVGTANCPTTNPDIETNTAKLLVEDAGTHDNDSIELATCEYNVINDSWNIEADFLHKNEKKLGGSSIPNFSISSTAFLYDYYDLKLNGKFNYANLSHNSIPFGPSGTLDLSKIKINSNSITLTETTGGVLTFELPLKGGATVGITGNFSKTTSLTEAFSNSSGVALSFTADEKYQKNVTFKQGKETHIVTGMVITNMIIPPLMLSSSPINESIDIWTHDIDYKLERRRVK